MLICEKVSIKPVNHEPLFKAVSFGVGQGEIVALLGPSGIGKSSLLDFISGHLSDQLVASGDVLLNEKSLVGLPAEKREIGLVFQDALLFPHLSVGENLAIALHRDHRGRALRRQKVDWALDQAGLPDFHDRDPGTLSGGQKARVALMRAILAEPKVLLLDEPFSKLDANLRAEMRSFTAEHIKISGIRAVLVTHDLDDAEHVANAIIRLEPFCAERHL